MAITYTYDQEKNLVWVKASGVISIPDILQHANKISEDMSIKEGFIEVIDLAETTEFEISFASAKNMIKQWDKWEHKSHKGSIMYAPTDTTFGIMRMMKSLTEMESGSDSIPHMVTRNKNDIPEIIRNIRASHN